MPRILAHGKTPAEWVKALAQHELEVSERTLRAAARSSGNYCSLGNAMILMPEHIDRIFEIGPRLAQQIDFSDHYLAVDQVMSSTVTLDEAMKHLENRTGKRKKKL